MPPATNKRKSPDGSSKKGSPAKKQTKFCVKAPKDPEDAVKNPFAFISTQMRSKAVYPEDARPFVIESHVARIISVHPNNTVLMANLDPKAVDEDGETPTFTSDAQYLAQSKHDRKMIQGNSVTIDENLFKDAIDAIIKSEQDAAAASGDDGASTAATSIIDCVSNKPIVHLSRDMQGEVITAMGDGVRRVPQIENSGEDHTPEAFTARVLHPIVMSLPERQKALRSAIIDKLYLNLPWKKETTKELDLPETGSPEACELWTKTARMFVYVCNRPVEAFLSPETGEPISRTSSAFEHTLKENLSTLTIPNLTTSDKEGEEQEQDDDSEPEKMKVKLMYSLSFNGVASCTRHVDPQDHRLLQHVDIKQPFYKALVNRLIELATLLVGEPPAYLVKYANGELESFSHADAASTYYKSKSDVTNVMSMDDCSMKNTMATLAKSTYRNPSVDDQSGESSVLYFASNAEKASVNALFAQVGIHDAGEEFSKAKLVALLKSVQETVLTIVANSIGAESTALVVSTKPSAVRKRKAPASASAPGSTDLLRDLIEKMFEDKLGGIESRLEAIAKHIGATSTGAGDGDEDSDGD
jgi:hypothetical protein